LLVRASRTQDVWEIPVDPGSVPRPLLAEAAAERDGRLSPDGRFLAYVTEESGRPEVSIQRLLPSRERVVISVGGGEQPVWGRDQSELFFVDPQGRLRTVPVRVSAGHLTLGQSSTLVVPPIGAGHWGTQYDVSPDGQRVYFLDRLQEERPRTMEIILGWRALLEEAIGGLGAGRNGLSLDVVAGYRRRRQGRWHATGTSLRASYSKRRNSTDSRPCLTINLT
jgi:hypothetical protein